MASELLAVVLCSFWVVAHAAGRRAEAAAVFETTLAVFPNRRSTLEDLTAARGAH